MKETSLIESRIITAFEMDNGKNFKRNPCDTSFFVLTRRLGPNTAFFSGYNTSGMICFVTSEEALLRLKCLVVKTKNLYYVNYAYDSSPCLDVIACLFEFMMRLSSLGRGRGSCMFSSESCLAESGHVKFL